MKKKNKEKEYFKEFRQRLYYQLDMIPIEVKLAFYEFGVFLKIKKFKKDRRSFDINLNIPIPEMVNMVLCWVYMYFPCFYHVDIKYVNRTAEETKQFILDNPYISVQDIIHKKKELKIIIKYIIEKVHTKDKTLVLIEDDQKYLYKYPDDIENIRQRIEEENKKNKLYNFIFGYCWMLKPYEKNFPINIRYKNEQMVNFFNLNKDIIKEEIKFDSEKGFYVWGRYRIHFYNKKSEEKCLGIIKRII